MKVTAIIAGAGSGKRLGHATDKPFIKIKGKPILAWTIEAVSKANLVNEIIVVVSKNNIDRTKKLINKFKLKKVVQIVVGGAKRTQSVKNGLNAVSNDTDIVAVHDGARTCIDKDTFNKAILATEKTGISCVCAKVKPTIKKVKDNILLGTIDRSNLWEAQTPQVFFKEILIEAYKKMKKNKKYTDDVSLVEDLGYKVKVVDGDHTNIKITTKEDLKIAEVFLCV